MKNNEKRFSLIELSIVLIIIGLLVAGITGGASLIKSAELRSFMSEARNYQTAVNAYYTATGELPGSSGSSQIDFDNSCLAWGEMMEEGIVDIDLSSVNFDNTPICAEITAVSDANSPTSKLKGALYAIGYNTDMAQNVIFAVADSETPGKLTAAVAPTEGTTYVKGTPVANPVLTRKDAKTIDDKMDNGIIDSGKVQSFSAGPEATAKCKYDNTGEGDSDSTKDCAVAIAIGL